jgi:hypothetical protein
MSFYGIDMETKTENSDLGVINISLNTALNTSVITSINTSVNTSLNI